VAGSDLSIPRMVFCALGFVSIRGLLWIYVIMGCYWQIYCKFFFDWG
jgi:hypothetical protein